MSEVALLSTERLEVLADHWRRERAPIAENLRPGLTDAEMEAVTDPLEIRLPVEARTWWGWHDGADAPRGYADDRYLGGYLEFLPLQEAAELYVTGRAGWMDSEEGADYWWPPSQFSITNPSRGQITFESAVAEGEPSPVYFSHFHDRRPETDFAQPAAASWGQLVNWWIEAWEEAPTAMTLTPSDGLIRWSESIRRGN